MPEDFEDSRGHVVAGGHEDLSDQAQSGLQVLVKRFDTDFESKAIAVPGRGFFGAVPVVTAHKAVDPAGGDIDLMAEGSIAVGFCVKDAEKCFKNTQAADVFFR